MNQRIKKTLTFLASVALGGVLLYLSLRGVDFESVVDALRTANYLWLIPLLIITLVAHLLRAWRWRLLLAVLPQKNASRPKLPLSLVFSSVMIGYMVNYAAPRLGEFARAGNIAARTSLRFAGVFGTVVVERILDVITLLLALCSVVVLYGEQLAGVTNVFLQNTENALVGLPTYVWIVATLLILAAIFAVVLWRFGNNTAPGTGKERLSGTLHSFRDGLNSLLRVKERAGLLFSTAGIWLCYTLMADIPLRMFGLTNQHSLSFLDSWALMNVGAIGMSLPSPGGTGSFHYVTVQTLVQMFEVGATPAATYALFAHASQLILFCVIGFICLLAQGSSFRSLKTTVSEARDSAEI
ncbi:MAG: lysylphosphatidylglycerol synthase transmembrane domain-containing protein [Rubricoccaceae bacterium]|nr:lysylphosphatidylglycerol synthase transmembrane domain-containing protein [Rubricoccaceae bacterium]